MGAVCRSSQATHSRRPEASAVWMGHSSRADRPRSMIATEPVTLLWLMSSPFEGLFGREDSGQTNDGPLDVEDKLLSGRAFRRIGVPSCGSASHWKVSLHVG